MFWALAAGVIDTRGFEFEHVLRDIQTLSAWALEGKLETTAMSLAAYPLVQDRYLLLPHGASMGSGYGPVVVGPRALSDDELRTTEVVIPGEMTTAFLTLRLYLGREFRYRVLPFDEILDEVKDGRAARGPADPRGPADVRAQGLVKSVDLGEWWLLETGLPLPLGVNVARRDLGERLHDLSEVLANRSAPGSTIATRRCATRCSSGAASTRGLADRFVGMYVNELTEDYGEEGREAVQELMSRAEALGVYSEPVRLEFVS